MPESQEARKKRLLYRCRHMGMRETDLLMGRFAEAHLDDFDASQLDDLERLLEEADHDLLNWILERESPPEREDTPVLRLIINFNKRR